MNIAQIGVGKWGKNHLRVLIELKSNKKIEKIKVVEINKGILENIKSQYKIEVTEDYKEVLEDKSINAVTIITPLDTHFKIAKEALLAGKHVFIEKPITETSKEAKELMELAEKNKLILMIGHIFRYNSAILKLREEIKQGTFGKVNFLFSQFMGLKPPRNDSGAMFSYAVHDVDLICYLIGQKLPLAVNASNGYFLGREIEDLSLITLEFENNIMAHLMATWLSPGKQRDLWVIGSEKSAYVERLSQKLEVYHNKIIPLERPEGAIAFKAEEGPITKPTIEFQEPLNMELTNFIKHVKEGSKPEADAFSGYRTILTLEKAMDSARKKKWVSI